MSHTNIKTISLMVIAISLAVSAGSYVEQGSRDTCKEALDRMIVLAKAAGDDIDYSAIKVAYSNEEQNNYLATCYAAQLNYGGMQ
jgi:hypothetical protein